MYLTVTVDIKLPKTYEKLSFVLNGRLRTELGEQFYCH